MLDGVPDQEDQRGVDLPPGLPPTLPERRGWGLASLFGTSFVPSRPVPTTTGERDESSLPTAAPVTQHDLRDAVKEAYRQGMRDVKSSMREERRGMPSSSTTPTRRWMPNVPPLNIPVPKAKSKSAPVPVPKQSANASHRANPVGTKSGAPSEYGTPHSDLIDLMTPKPQVGARTQPDIFNIATPVIQEVHEDMGEMGDPVPEHGVSHTMYKVTASGADPPPPPSSSSSSSQRDNDRPPRRHGRWHRNDDANLWAWKGQKGPDVRIKEADTLRLQPLPDPGLFDPWIVHTRLEVTSGSGRGQQAFEWVLRVEDLDTTFEELGDPGDFPSLDSKLASAISKIAKGRVGKKIITRTKELAKMKKMITGRQALYIIVREYALDEERGSVYDLADLLAVKNPKGDASLEVFIEEWDDVLTSMTEPPEERYKEFLFLEQIKGSTLLAPEVAEYRRAPRGDHRRSYTFLYDAAKRLLNRQRQEQNRSAKLRNMQGKSTHGTPTLPATEPEESQEPAAPTLPSKDLPCFDFQQGKCNRGDACEYSHDISKDGPKPKAKAKAKAKPKPLTQEELDRRKNVPCNNFAKGHCRFGDRCQFDHSVTNATVCIETAVPCTPFISPGESATDGDAIPHRVRSWVVDTGSGNHLVGRNRLDQAHLDRLQRAPTKRLQTANGVITIDEAAHVESGALNDTVNALVLPSTADVLSVGKLCYDDGYTFIWNAHCPPLLYRPDKSMVPLRLDQLVPVLEESAGHDVPMCMPAADAQPDAAPIANELQIVPYVDPRSAEQKLKDEAVSARHMMTHVPKNPFCKVCQRAKMYRQQARRKDPDIKAGEAPKKFGDLIQADHLVVGRSKVTHGLGNEKVALFVWDRATGIKDAPAMKSKAARNTELALKTFTDGSAKSLYSDNAPELIKAAENLGLVHPTSTPHRPQSNSVTERQIRVTVEGTRAALVQSGLPHRFWPLALRHHTMSENIARAGEDGKTPWERLHGEAFNGLQIPFGALVSFRPTPQMRRGVGKFAAPTTEGIFAGWHLDPGMKHKGDVLILAVRDLLKLDLKTDKVPVYRIKPKEVIADPPFTFPMQFKERDEILNQLAEKGAPDDEDIEEGAHDPGFAYDAEDDVRAIRDRESDLKAIENDNGDDHMGLERPDGLLKIGDYHEDDERSTTSSVDAIGDEAAGGDGTPLPSPQSPENSPSPTESSPTENPQCMQIDSSSTGSPSYTHVDSPFLDGDMAAQIFGDADIAEDAVPAVQVPGKRPSDIEEIEWARLNKRERKNLLKDRKAEDDDRTDERYYHALTAMDAPSMVPNPSTSPTPSMSTQGTPKRLLIEYCCSPTSKIGANKTDGCEVLRLTEDIDMTTPNGLRVALDAVDRAKKEGIYVALWASLPCTAGCPWQRLNRKRKSARKKIRQHKIVFNKLMDNFVILAGAVDECNGDIHFEWPANCSLWKDHKVRNLADKHSLNRVTFHGCAAELKAKDGRPIKKPWALMTSSSNMCDAMSIFQCPGAKAHPSHAPCAGSDTKRTEEYTDVMTKAVHAAIELDAIAYHAPSAAMTTVVDHAPETEDHTMQDGHRPRIQTPMWCSMVTKTLPRSDPLCRSAEAKQALHAELSDIRAQSVWDEDHPMEASEAAKAHPDAHFTRVFDIYGIKHYEEADTSRRKWKCRVVVEGCDIKTSSGDWATFAELGSVPSSMCAARIAMSMYAVDKDSDLLQSDCVRAYIQADMRGPPTFVRLPKHMQPKEWFHADGTPKYKDPVVRLLKALYGHPLAGDYWADKLAGVLGDHGYVRDEAWPGVFVKNAGTNKVTMIIVYVDDILFAGNKMELNSVIPSICKVIDMEEPGSLAKYLGVHHKVNRDSNGTEMIFDMRDYFRTAVDTFQKECEVTLKPAPTPYPPELKQSDLDDLQSRPGKWASTAASYVMRLMYGARMAHPGVMTAVCRLSRELSRWTADSDRKLLRIMSYVSGSTDHALHGSLYYEDRDHLRLVAWPDADLCGDEMSSRSTSGFFLELVGKHGRSFPLTWGSKRQTCTASHTAEAEMVSLSACLRTELIPCQALLEKVLGRPVTAEIQEDNSACIIAANKGYSPSLRYLRRTQRIAIGAVHDILHRERDKDEGPVILMKAASSDQKGDLFTKAMARPAFERALSLIGWKPVA